MGWTSKVQLHVRAPVTVTRLVRRRFTHKGFQNFVASYRGLCGIDIESAHATAHAEFSAFALVKVDEEHAQQMKAALGGCLGLRGVDTGVLGRIADLAADASGELVYSFSIWKDNIVEVSQRLLAVMELALKQELGPKWRSLRLGKDILFVHAFANLGYNEESYFDLMPSLIRGGRINYADTFMVQDEEVQDAPRADLARFAEFSAELLSLHEECEPDAFGCHAGGSNARVRIQGLQSRQDLNGQDGVILGPVDLETRRWPVKLLRSGSSVSVRRINLVPV